MDTGTILGLDTGTFVGIAGVVVGVIFALLGMADGRRTAGETQRRLDTVLGEQAAERETMEAMKAALDQLVVGAIAANPGKTREIAVQLAGRSRLGGGATGAVGTFPPVPSEEDTRAVAKAITELPEDEKLFLALNYYEDMDEVEIGELLKRTPEQIQALQRVAFRHLEDDLGPYFGSDTIE